MKIVNGKKFVRSILLILGILFVLSLVISKSTLSYKELEYKTIYVSEGDTLWNIAVAESKTNEYYKNKDIRDIINNIAKANKLSNSNIQANQKLVIPVL